MEVEPGETIEVVDSPAEPERVEDNSIDDFSTDESQTVIVNVETPDPPAENDACSHHVEILERLGRLEEGQATMLAAQVVDLEQGVEPEPEPVPEPEPKSEVVEVDDTPTPGADDGKGPESPPEAPRRRPRRFGR